MSDTESMLKINKAIVDSKLSSNGGNSSDCVSLQLEQIRREIQALAKEARLRGLTGQQ